MAVPTSSHSVVRLSRQRCRLGALPLVTSVFVKTAFGIRRVIFYTFLPYATSLLFLEFAISTSSGIKTLRTLQLLLFSGKHKVPLKDTREIFEQPVMPVKIFAKCNQWIDFKPLKNIDFFVKGYFFFHGKKTLVMCHTGKNKIECLWYNYTHFKAVRLKLKPGFLLRCNSYTIKLWIWPKYW